MSLIDPNVVLANAQELIGAYKEMEAGFEARINAAAEDAASLERTFYVDQLNGSDESAGTEADPLKSIYRANQLSPLGGRTFINLQGDYQLRHRFSVRPAALIIKGNSTTFTFANDSENDAGNQPAFICNRSTTPSIAVVMQHLDLVLPADAGEEGMLVNTGVINLILKSLDISLATTDPTRTIMNGSGSISLTTSSVVEAAAMAGRWIQGVPAGTAHSAVSRLGSSTKTTL